MDHVSFIHSSVDGHVGCVHLLSIVSNIAVNISVDARFHSSWAHARSGIARPHGNFVFDALRNCQTGFHSGCAMSRPPSTARGPSFSTSSSTRVRGSGGFCELPLFTPTLNAHASQRGCLPPSRRHTLTSPHAHSRTHIPTRTPRTESCSRKPQAPVPDPSGAHSSRAA